MASLNLTAAAVDPKQYPPDQTDRWAGIPLQHDQWVHTHNALRKEIRSMLDALDSMAGRLKSERAVPGWAAGVIKEWWDGHLAHAVDHCQAEEEMYRPLLSTRFVWPREMETIHNQLDFVRDKVSKAVSNLNSDKATLSALRNAMAAYEKTLLAHFAVEERTALPLMRAYFPPNPEISALQRKMLEQAPDHAVGALIYAMGPQKFRNEFMRERAIPFFVWHVAFRGRFNRYEAEMVAKVRAIRRVVKPEDPSDKKGGWLPNRGQKNGGWKTAVDASSGETYYYHSKTKETRWEKPDDYDDEALDDGRQGKR